MDRFCVEPSVDVAVGVEIAEGVGVEMVESMADPDVPVGLGIDELGVGVEALFPHAVAKARRIVTTGMTTLLLNITAPPMTPQISSRAGQPLYLIL